MARASSKHDAGGQAGDRQHTEPETPPTDNPAVAPPDAGAASPEADEIGLNTNVPNVARMYDYWLGGKDNFAADRATAEEILQDTPEVRDTVHANRELLGRVVRYLAEHGIRQFIDLGSGLPTQENVHEVAQAAAPDARVVYIDNDPVVLSHGRALLAHGQPDVKAIKADLREPATILNHPEVRALIDFTKPVGVLAFAVLHFLKDEPAYDVGNTLMAACPPGSYFAVSHVLDTAEAQRGQAIYAKRRTNAIVLPRSHEEIRRFFDGLELVHPELEPLANMKPDLAYLSQWKQEEDGVKWRDRLTLCGVARKPETCPGGLLGASQDPTRPNGGPSVDGD